ncbi:MAG TPA: ABC transporter permease [Deinococcales bacterium]|nr:ABC transporter permease [Deinococcales bacterium]
MKQVLLIARFTWQEAVRKRLVLAALVMTVLFLVLYLFGVNALQRSLEARAAAGGGTGRGGLFAQATLLGMGMYFVNFLGSLMGVLAAVAAVSGEVESGALQAVLPKPLRRSQYLLGRWLGLAALAVIYLVVLSTFLIGGTSLISGFTPPQPVAAVAIICLNAVLLLTLSVLGGTFLSTLANGVVVFLIYGLGWAGGVMRTVGIVTDTPLVERLGNLSTYLIPVDALWKGASVYLQPEAMRMFGRASVMEANPFFGTAFPSPLLVGYACLYLAGALLLALYLFDRRDI